MLTQQNLSLVTEGMDVYGRDGVQIGTVKAFRQGEGTIKTTETDIITMANAVAECLGGQKELPTILYSRLYDEGFICIDRGFLRKDMIAFTGQVGDISGNSIFLKVEQAELVKV